MSVHVDQLTGMRWRRQIRKHRAELGPGRKLPHRILSWANAGLEWPEPTVLVSLRIPDTVGDLSITVDLKARQNIVSVTLDAPVDKGGRGRIGWLLRQLREAPPNLVIEAYAKNARNGVAAPLSAAIEDPTILIGPDKKEPAKFTLVARTEVGTNRKAGRKPGFTQSVIASIESFYGDVLQNLTVYQAAAPKLERRSPLAAQHEPQPLPSVPLVEAEPPNADDITVKQTSPELVIEPPANWFVTR